MIEIEVFDVLVLMCTSFIAGVFLAYMLVKRWVKKLKQ